MIRKLDLKQKVLNDLIERRLILNIAKELGIRVTDEALRDYIANNPLFQDKGVFDRTLYMRVLRSNRITPAEYEEAQRMDLLIERVKNLLQDSVKVSEREIDDVYSLRHQKIALRFVRISPSLFIDRVNFSDKKIKEYYAKNKKLFRIPEMVKIQYLLFDPERFVKDVPVSREEVEDYYRVNRERFREPERVRIRQILIKVKPDAPPERVKEARRRMERILERLKNGESFEKLAKKYSEDPVSAKKGGDLGYFKRGELIRTLENEAFRLKKGEISRIIRTDYGFHIIKVEDIKKEKIKSLKEVYPDLVKRLKREKVRDYTEEIARGCFNRIYKSRDLGLCADGKRIRVKESDYFGYNSGIKDIGDKEKVTKVAFSLKKGEISGVIETREGFLIIKLLDRKRSKIPPLKEIKERVIKAYKNKEALKIAEKEAKRMLKLLKEGRTSLQEIARRNGLTVEETGLFSMGDGFIPNIGFSKEMEEEVFLLSEKEKYPSSPFKIGNNFYIVELVKRVEGGDKINPEREKIKDNLLFLRKEEIFRRWIERVKSRAKIKIKPEVLANL